MGQQTASQIPWAYGFFYNGQPITKFHRRRSRDRVDLQHAFPNPYRTIDVNRSFYHWFEANDEITAAAKFD
jgi:hypothetical protein